LFLHSNDSIKRLKGAKRPLVDEWERAEMLAALECVEWVTIFSEDTPGKVIRELKPDVLIKGGDYSLNEIVGRDFVESYKGKVLTVPLFEGWSSTKLIETILKKYG
jgi:D-beta-D-heptose 7-phosphate kinase/D-beta-D-heptose 1-phosphate adenosyltransferase